MRFRRWPSTSLAPLGLLLGVLLHFGAVAVAAPRSPDTSLAATVETRLPPDTVYSHALSADSAVIFSHRSHVEFADGLCTGCHPQTFPMLRKAPGPRHSEMDSGASCGTCHDGRKAFATRSPADCRACHSGMPGLRLAGGARAGAALRRSPTPHVFPRGADSPGTVTFRHESHLRPGAGCAACHPRLFAMASAPPRPNGGMHERAACGACHDGTRAFGCEDTGACARCHAAAEAGR